MAFFPMAGSLDPSLDRAGKTAAECTRSSAAVFEADASIPSTRDLQVFKKRFHRTGVNDHGHQSGFVDLQIGGFGVPNEIELLPLKPRHWAIREYLHVAPPHAPCERGLVELDLYRTFGCLAGSSTDLPFKSRRAAEAYLGRVGSYLESLPGFQYWVRRARQGSGEAYPVIDHKRDIERLWMECLGVGFRQIGQVEQLMAEALQQCKVKTRLTLRGMIGILEDGRVKHYRELPENEEFVKSGIVNARDVIDQRWYPGRSPVYGYAEPVNASNANAHIYGSVEIIWKDQVKEQTVVTFGDSLNEYQFLGEPTPFTRPGYLSAAPLLALGWKGPEDIRRQIKNRAIAYIEANQTKRPSVRDIEQVVIYRTSQDTDGLRERCEAMLKAAGIPFEIKRRKYLPGCRTL